MLWLKSEPILEKIRTPDRWLAVGEPAKVLLRRIVKDRKKH